MTEPPGPQRRQPVLVVPRRRPRLASPIPSGPGPRRHGRITLAIKRILVPVLVGIGVRIGMAIAAAHPTMRSEHVEWPEAPSSPTHAWDGMPRLPRPDYSYGAWATGTGSGDGESEFQEVMLLPDMHAAR